MNFATFFILFLKAQSFVIITKIVKPRNLELMDNCKNETYPKPSVLIRVEVKDLYMNDWMEGEVVWDIDTVGNDEKTTDADNINDMFNLFF